MFLDLLREEREDEDKAQQREMSGHHCDACGRRMQPDAVNPCMGRCMNDDCDYFGLLFPLL
jgi:methionyl-tRNA synthetase